MGRLAAGAVAAYNSAVGSMETRVLVAARQFKELGVGARDDLAAVETVVKTTRAVQAVDLIAVPEGGADGAVGDEKDDSAEGDG